MNILTPKFTIRPAPDEQPLFSALRAVHGCNGTPPALEKLLGKLYGATSFGR